MIVRLIKGVTEIFKQFLVFFLVFAVSLILFSIISATLEKANASENSRYSYIKVPELTLINKQNIILGDIAEIYIKDSNLKAYAMKLNLGSAPMPGEWRYLKGLYIRRFLERALASNIKIIVPDKVKVISKVRYVDENELKNELIEFIKSNDVWQERLNSGAKLVINGKLINKAIAAPDRELKYKFKVSGNDDLLGATNIECRVYDGDALYKKLWLRPRLAFSGPIVVAKKNISPGTIIDESMLEERTLSFENAPAKFFSSVKEIIGYRSKGILRKGIAITEPYVEKPHLVNFGDLVTLIAGNDSISITMQGKALGRGYQGAFVRVQNLKSRKIVLAKVIGERTLKVEF